MLAVQLGGVFWAQGFGATACGSWGMDFVVVWALRGVISVCMKIKGLVQTNVLECRFLRAFVLQERLSA